MSVNKKLNRLAGIVSILSLSVSSENQYSTAVLPEGILVKKSDDVLYRTDGIRPIRNLIPVADQVLNAQEKLALSSAFNNGVYRANAGGVVIHNSSGKIDDASLGIFESGKLKEQYLSDFVSNGMIKYSKLPDDVKKGFIIAANYNTLSTLSVDDKKRLVVVLDASGDPSGTVIGNGLYYYYNNAWTNLLSSTELDVTYEKVQAVGGIMYDHPVDIGVTDDTIHQLLDALVIGEGEIDNPGGDEPGTDDPTTPVIMHDETPDYVGLGWQNFITNVNRMLLAPPDDVYVEGPAILDNNSLAMFTVQSDELNLAQTTVTLTNATTNYTATFPVTNLVENAVDYGVVEYGDPAKAFTSHNATSQERNQVIHYVVSDGVTTFTKDMLKQELEWYLPNIVVDTSDGWTRT